MCYRKNMIIIIYFVQCRTVYGKISNYLRVVLQRPNYILKTQRRDLLGTHPCHKYALSIYTDINVYIIFIPFYIMNTVVLYEFFYIIVRPLSPMVPNSTQGTDNFCKFSAVTDHFLIPPSLYYFLFSLGHKKINKISNTVNNVENVFIIDHWRRVRGRRLGTAALHSIPFLYLNVQRNCSPTPFKKWNDHQWEGWAPLCLSMYVCKYSGATTYGRVRSGYWGHGWISLPQGSGERPDCARSTGHEFCSVLAGPFNNESIYGFDCTQMYYSNRSFTMRN